MGSLVVAMACVAACAARQREATVESAAPDRERRVFGDMTTLAGDQTDKGLAGHHFTEIYEHILSPLRYEPIRILEIGIAKGASLALWEDYFPEARIYGIDIEDASALNRERVTTFVADQSNRQQLEAFIRAHGGEFDFILDDGGHTMEMQQISLGYLFPHVKPGGYYIVEDVHTSLRKIWGAVYGAEEDEKNTTLTMIIEYMRSSTIASRYMTPEEQTYLADRIAYSNLFFRKRSSMTCIFKKK